MSKTQPPPAPPEQQQQIPTILPMEVLGIIQRSLGELNGYLGQPAGMVDPAMIMMRLERIVQWVCTLPPVQQPQQQPQAPKGSPNPARPN